MFVATPEPTVPADITQVIPTDELSGQDWLVAAAIIVASIALAVLVQRGARRVLGSLMGTSFAAVITARVLAYLTVLVGLVYALSQLNVQVGPLLGAIGLSSLVLALALQKVVEDFVGALILQTRRPFTIGETVELDEHRGRVLDIDARTVVLRSLDGTTIRIPNSSALASRIINLTRKPVRRTEIDVGVAYDTDLRRATGVITDAAKKVPTVLREPAPQVYLRQFGASSIDFVVYVWHRSDVPTEMQTRHDTMAAIHHDLAAAGITIAFPQMVVWPSHEANPNPYGDTPQDWFDGVAEDDTEHVDDFDEPRRRRQSS